VSIRPEFWQLLLLAALASLSCRLGGFWLMRFVDITPRVQAALRATPLGVMIGIVTPVALRGGPAEWLAVALTVIAMRLTRSDLGSALCGVAVVAMFRSLNLAA
jgi:uncharacterized membrane protein